MVEVLSVREVSTAVTMAGKLACLPPLARQVTSLNSGWKAERVPWKRQLATCARNCLRACERSDDCIRN
eukprot:7259317-Pyramimonas_sp.AAC.1